MADLQKTIAIIFSGVDELSGPINKITSKNILTGKPGLQNYSQSRNH